MARYKHVSRNNLPWFQHFTFPCPTPSVPPGLLLLLVATYEKGNRFTSATRYRKISQGLTSRQFLKMKNNLGRISSHLCTNNLLSNYNCVVAKIRFTNSQSHPKMWIQTCIKNFRYRLQGNGGGVWFLISSSLLSQISLFWKWKVKLI